MQLIGHQKKKNDKNEWLWRKTQVMIGETYMD